MAKITISMPDAMEQYVATRVEAGQYGNVSEYFRDLVRREQERLAGEERLRQMLQKGIDSGVSERTPEQIFADAKRRRAKVNG